MFYLEYDSIEKNENLNNSNWVLVYSTVDSINKNVLDNIKKKVPKADVFGTTSFNGVFTPNGFKTGCFLLAGEKNDNIETTSIIKECTKENSFKVAQEAALELKNSANRLPDVILFHPTPGFEESILNGLESIFDAKTPIYGGSAADNDLSGNWLIFKNQQIVKEGFLIVGYYAPKFYSSFISGYLPTKNTGIVTKAEGRTIYEVDNKPFTDVYQEWTNGLLKDELKENENSVVLGKTSLKPLGKMISSSGNLQQYIISHPHIVSPKEKSISLFTDFNVGDEITLMFGSEGALLKRVEQTVSRATHKKDLELKGGILIYCAGCVGVLGDKVDEVVESFNISTKNIPFLGAATFGEQGCIKTSKNLNLHGNLMCNTILF
ncbi:MAG: FIST N-terminal domain-containing protein [Cyanobacteriota bacterium]|mgnify:CR=1 FL=1